MLTPIVSLFVVGCSVGVGLGRRSNRATEARMSVRVVTRVQAMKTATTRAVSALSGQYGPVGGWAARDKQRLNEVVRVHDDGQTVVVAKDQRLFDVLEAAEQPHTQRADPHTDTKHSVPATVASAADASGDRYADAVSAGNGTVGTGTAALVSRRFVLDRAFPPSLSHAELYGRSIKELVRSTFEGGRFCVIACGGARSGKTYTLLGTEPISTLGDGSQPARGGTNVGLMARSLYDMHHTARVQSIAARAYQLRVTCVRVQNELVYDVLAGTTAHAPASNAANVSLRIHDGGDDPDGDTHVVGAESLRINAVRDITILIDRFRSARIQHPFAHVIVTATLEQITLTNAATAAAVAANGSKPDVWAKMVVTKVQFAEVAGRDAPASIPTVSGAIGATSRPAALPGSASRPTPASGKAETAQKSVKSLNALETVLGVLSARLQANAATLTTAAAHIPYRNSKLTHVMKDW